jgi:aryl-alcohol dehydrogenase-like predicted oxidoreductase
MIASFAVRQRLLDGTQLPVVGCGDVRLATAAARGRDPRDVERALHEALELGIRLVDVSEEPDAERLCADAIRTQRLRDVAVLASRIPLVAPVPGRPNRDVLPERLPARYVVERVEATLRTTRLDVIPLVQLPLSAAWRGSSAWTELAGTCARLVREGKAMRFAAAVDEPEGADAFADDPFLVALALPYNACRRLPEPLFTSRLAILARQPLAGGALAGSLGPGAPLARNDDRRAIDTPMLEKIAAAAATLSPLVKHEPAAARSCDAAKAALERAHRTHDVEATTLAELCLRYVCDRAFALPRLHDRAHIADAIAAALAPPLSLPIRERIDEVLA